MSRLPANARLANRYYVRPVGDHFDGARFFNLDGPREAKTLGDMLRWQLGGTRARWPKWIDIDPARPTERIHEGLQAAFVGHSTVLLQSGGLNVLTDPVWSKRASPVGFAGPKRVHAPGIAFDHLPRIDLIIVSHNHYDHLDTATLAWLVERDDPVIVTPLGNDRIIKAAVPSAKTITLDWLESAAPLPSVRVHAEPVNHWSSRSGRDRNQALWAGFVIEIGDKRVYFAGDTGFAAGAPFSRTADRHGAFDLALLPIGAYAPRWFMADSHMDPFEAVAANVLLGSPPTLAIHHGTFQLTDEPIDEPTRLLAQALTREPRAGDFRVLKPGESWSI